MNFAHDGQPRFKRNALTKAGDVVIVTACRSHHQALRLEPGLIYNCKYGHFSHDDMIGVAFGGWVRSRVGRNGPRGKKRGRVMMLKKKGSMAQQYGEICVLRPSPNLWTKTLSHRTQILYDADKSLIVHLLRLRPGHVVFESGTGSGSLSTSMAQVLSPSGHLFTFEFNQLRVDYARLDFLNLSIDDIVTVLQRDVLELGFPDRAQLAQLLADVCVPVENGDVASEGKGKSEYRDSFGGSSRVDAGVLVDVR